MTGDMDSINVLLKWMGCSRVAMLRHSTFTYRPLIEAGVVIILTMQNPCHSDLAYFLPCNYHAIPTWHTFCLAKIMPILFGTVFA
mgnify:CR=1 FL=1